MLTELQARGRGYRMLTYEYNFSEGDMLEAAYKQLQLDGIPAAVVPVKDQPRFTLWRKYE